MAVGLAGCNSKKIELNRPPEGDLQKKFELTCFKDYKLHVITRMVEKTFWIYVPTDQPLFDFAAEAPSPGDPLKKPAKYELIYIDGSFKEHAFNFEYDVVPKTKANLNNEGITNKGTEFFDGLYTKLFNIIQQTLLAPKTPISFVVIAITDIKKGIEVRYTFYLEDFRKQSMDALPGDEFSKRVLQESKGSKDYIGDEIGQHLEYTDIKMPDFLAKQIVNRIRFTFTQSDFPPQQDYEQVILGTIADTVRYYHFKDFQEVRTNDLRSKKKKIFAPGDLEYFGEDKSKDKDAKSNGKLIHIIFENGKTTFKDE